MLSPGVCDLLSSGLWYCNACVQITLFFQVFVVCASTGATACMCFLLLPPGLQGSDCQARQQVPHAEPSFESSSNSCFTQYGLKAIAVVCMLIRTAHASQRGRGTKLSRVAWAELWVPGLPRLYSKTLFQNHTHTNRTHKTKQIKNDNHKDDPKVQEQ